MTLQIAVGTQLVAASRRLERIIPGIKINDELKVCGRGRWPNDSWLVGFATKSAPLWEMHTAEIRVLYMMGDLTEVRNED